MGRRSQACWRGWSVGEAERRSGRERAVQVIARSRDEGGDEARPGPARRQTGGGRAQRVSRPARAPSRRPPERLGRVDPLGHARSGPSSGEVVGDAPGPRARRHWRRSDQRAGRLSPTPSSRIAFSISAWRRCASASSSSVLTSAVGDERVVGQRVRARPNPALIRFTPPHSAAAPTAASGSPGERGRTSSRRHRRRPTSQYSIGVQPASKVASIRPAHPRLLAIVSEKRGRPVAADRDARVSIEGRLSRSQIVRSLTAAYRTRDRLECRGPPGGVGTALASRARTSRARRPLEPRVSRSRRTLGPADLPRWTAAVRGRW